MMGGMVDARTTPSIHHHQEGQTVQVRTGGEST